MNFEILFRNGSNKTDINRSGSHTVKLIPVSTIAPLFYFLIFFMPHKVPFYLELGANVSHTFYMVVTQSLYQCVLYDYDIIFYLEFGSNVSHTFLWLSHSHCTSMQNMLVISYFIWNSGLMSLIHFICLLFNPYILLLNPFNNLQFFSQYNLMEFFLVRCKFVYLSYDFTKRTNKIGLERIIHKKMIIIIKSVRITILLYR